MFFGGVLFIAAYVFIGVALVVALIRLVLHATTVLKLSAQERRIRIELLRIEADVEGGVEP